MQRRGEEVDDRREFGDTKVIQLRDKEIAFQLEQENVDRKLPKVGVVPFRASPILVVHCLILELATISFSRIYY